METLTNLSSHRPKTLLFASAALIRVVLALAFPALPDLLTGRLEISTPVSSFKRLQEGLFLYDRGLDPYDGGIFHQAPLLLPLFSLLLSPSTWLGRLVSLLLYTALDLGAADALYDIAECGAAYLSLTYVSPRREKGWSPLSVAAVYLFNPATLLTCLGRPTTVFTTFFVFLSIKHACQAKALTSTLALAIASYTSLHCAFLLPPVCLLCYDRVCLQITTKTTTATPSSSQKVSYDQRSLPSAITFTLSLLLGYSLIVAALILASRTFLPSWFFLRSVYLTPLQLPDLTPNSGLWWYFFTEMFDAFRSFFLGVFWLHILSYSIPFCLRLRRQPLAAVVLMLGVIAVFQPYANAGDAGAWLSMVCLLGHVFELQSTHRYTFPAIAALLYCTLLAPAFHHLWIYAGSGNANFFYAITLVWNLGLLILLTDTLYSVLRDEWESERPDGKGKEVRQI